MSQDAPKLKDLIPELQRICTELEGLAHQTVAHRRKFLFACYQFHHFIEVFQSRVSDTAFITQKQINVYRRIADIAQEYQMLFGQNMIHCWAHAALENSCTAFASELCSMTLRLQENTAILDEEASKVFDPDTSQWLQYHILDLKAIATSFSQYVPQANDPTAMIMAKRLESINSFLKQYQNFSPAAQTDQCSPIPVHYQQWRLAHSSFSIEKEIGSGVSSNVFYGYDKRNGNAVAIKQLKFKKLTGQKLQSFQRELSILATADHPALLKFVGATDTPPYWIITEWMPNGNLYQDLHKNHKLDETMRTIAMYDIARGMQFLHSRQIIHRDLKSLNVLLDKNGYTKICDFGFSRKANKEDVLTQNIGTPHWMAPELLNAENGYDNKIDVYAYGIVCWELLTGQLPYAGLESTQIIAMVLMNDMRPQFPSNVSAQLKTFISDCWARDPKMRPTFNQIVRRLKKGDILIEGTNKDAFMKYINSIAEPEQSVVEETIESQLISLPLDSGTPNDISSEEAIKEFISTIEKDGVPQELLKRCWESVSKINQNSYLDLYVRGLATFLSTNYVYKASIALRKLPHDSLPPKIVMAVIATIPSGNDEVDSNLNVIACKNGFYVEAALHAMQPNDLKLALEVAAQKGVPSDKVHNLTDHCTQYLMDEDPMVSVAAIRCLVSMGEAKRISIDTLKMQMQSKNETLKYSAFIAAAQISIEGVQLPIELIDSLITKIEKEPLAASVLIAASLNFDIARHIVNAFLYGNTPLHLQSVVMKILQVAKKHVQLQSMIEQITKAFLQ